MKNNLLRVALYIRVSSEEQANSGDSIRDQKERCEKYIADHENMALQDTYIDDGISGQKLKRDDFQRLLQSVKDRKVDLIIFTKLDRWFRNLRHYLNTQAVLDKNDVSWTAIDQPYFDTSTPYGRAFVAQSMTWAELEAQNGGQRVKDVFKTKVQHGEVITGKVLRGYCIQDKHLVLSDEAPAMYDSIAYFLRTQSMGKTIKYMQQTHGITMTLQNFRNSYLRNEKLTGRYRGVENYCPRLISDEMFAQAQKLLDEKRNVRVSQKYPYIFTGLLVCSECGYKMSGCHINVVVKKKGEVYRYRYPAYECKQYGAYHRCNNGGEIRESRIEEYLLEHIGEEIDRYMADYDASGQAVIDNRAKKNKIRRKLDRLKELFLNELVTLDEYKLDREALEAQLEQIPDIEEPKKNLIELKHLLDNDFNILYKDFSNEEKRLFWRSIIKEILVPKSVNRHRKYKIIPL